MKQPLRSVLLVDDNDADNYLHRLIIREAGVAEDIVDQPDGVDAIDYLKALHDQNDADPPELIFLDINMPRMNGWEFLEAYEQLPEPLRQAVVVIMLTTSIFPDDQERAQARPGFCGFLNKPLTEADLLELLRKHFGDRF